MSSVITRTPGIIAATCILALVTGCSRPIAFFPANESCESAQFVLQDDFEGARRGDCEVFADGHARIHIKPEDSGPINNSPWYAFRLTPLTSGTATVDIRYHGGNHRYRPKLSSNGTDWRPIDESRVEEYGFGSGAKLQIEMRDHPIWIAAQELILPEQMNRWIDGIAAAGTVSHSIQGRSIGGEPLSRLDINPAASEVVFLAGRQHPPEVTGAIGFLAFYEALLADNSTANAFRERFHTVALPMLNPDGVKAGHWRHNMNGVDLNRDWGPFTQPEVQLVQRILEQLDSQRKRILVSVDFHSTANNLIYRQEDGDATEPAEFSKQWIAAALARLPGYEFADEPRPASAQENSRNYMHQRYGIPAVTFELGDQENRDAIRQISTIFAEEFMRLLNETPRAAIEELAAHSR